MSEGLPRIVLASANAGKAREFDRLLAGIAHVEPLPCDVELPPEGLSTFKANAQLEGLGRLRRPWAARRPCSRTTRAWRSGRSTGNRA